jgi:protein O-mannosyl-transferase
MSSPPSRSPAHSAPWIARRLAHPVVIALLLAAVTTAVYWPVLRHEFIKYDDDEYVTENFVIQRGPILHSLAWAFTTTHSANWHPLTWWSHLLDYQLYGLQAGGHHLTSLVLHVVNAVLLFVVLRQMTQRLWSSAWVAALFALHPLQVESVAWIAERKNVLSTLFFLLTVWAYGRYAQKSEVGAKRSAIGNQRQETRPPTSDRRPWASGYYWLAVLWFALSLMSKPMLVTLPFVLLLLDYWPLQRVGFEELKSARVTVPRLIREKVPFFVLSALSCSVTYWAQSKGAAMASMAGLPMAARAQNAVVSYARYLGKLLWPVDLAVFYPHPGHWPWGTVTAAGLVVAGLCLLAAWQSRSAPYLTVGLFWFLGTLVPVIGLVQVGGQSLADRYVYVPAIGLIIVVAWGLEEAVGRWRLSKVLVGVGAVVVLAVCAGRTRDQLKYWQDGEKLFAHALAVTRGNYVAYDCLASVQFRQGRVDEAITHLRKALELSPNYALSHHNLGCALLAQGHMDEAAAHFRKALDLQPGNAQSHNNFGVVLRQQGQLGDAMAHFQKALEIKPDYAEAHNNLGLALRRQGQLESAIAHFLKALEIRPDYAEAHNNFAVALRHQGQLGNAIDHLQRAVAIQPDLADAHNNLGLALLETGRADEAIGQFQQVLAMRPDHAQAKQGLDLARRQQRQVKQSLAP